jgi:hypothetical protein
LEKVKRPEVSELVVREEVKKEESVLV